MARKFLGGKPTVGSTDVPVILESRTITATAPVTIAGTTSADLSADRTIAVSAASTSAAGVVQLSDSTSTTSSTLAATPTAVKSAYELANAAVPNTRTVAGTAPVTINGVSTTGQALSSNLTVAVTAASTSAAGIVQLSDSISTTSSTVAATSTAVKAAYDAVGKQETFGSITSTSGTIDYNYSTATTFYHTSSPTADWTVNFTNVPTTDNFAYNFTIVVPQGATAKKVTAAEIGGSSATIKWAGSTAAPVGNNSKTDIWIFSLFRVSGAWTVLGVQSANFG